MVATNRTSNITWYPNTDPTILRGRITAYDNDWFFLPIGAPEQVMVSSQDDDDAIVSADVSGGKVTLGAMDDTGSAIDVTRFDMVIRVILKAQ